jgi:aerobic carbon-monoxide dehydrogenase medium subunit
LRVSDTEVLSPTSAAEAVQAFGDGRDVTVFAGGTILMPARAYGRFPPNPRTLMLHHAGLDDVGGDGSVVVGAMTRLSTLAAGGLEPLATAAGEVADIEVRAQATIGGNLCAPPGLESPRGDLQAPLVALGARVSSAGAGGEQTEPVEQFLARGPDDPRLVLAVEFERPRRAAYLSQRRSHAHSYTVMSVACTETADGVRVAAGGIGPTATRLDSVERALAEGAAPDQAAATAADALQPVDDALASAWYRAAVLPTLLRRALEHLQGA